MGSCAVSHIFISYSRKNQAYARALAEDLREHGFDVWIDDRIDIGDRWFAVIVRAIETSGALVVVMTPDSEQSEWVQREILIAQRDHRPIFPILLEGREFGVLIDLQYQDARAQGQMPDAGFYQRLGLRVQPRPTKGEFVEAETHEIQRVTTGDAIPEGFRTRPEPRRFGGLGLWLMLGFFGMLVLAAGAFLFLGAGGDDEGESLAADDATASAVVEAAVSDTPTEAPTIAPSDTPTDIPTDTPPPIPTDTPTEVPTETPPPTPFAGSVGGDIVFESRRDGAWEIYLMTVGGGNPRRLTRDGADDHNPVFSPDGTRIAYDSFRSGDNEIIIMDADGSNAVNITDNEEDEFYPSWSADGTRIAFSTTRDDNSEIYVMNADGTNPVNLTLHPSDDRSPRFSPDGSQIAFRSDREGNFDVFVMDVDGGNVRRLAFNIEHDSSPSWSPDGSMIAFYSLPGDAEIFVINVDGSGQRRLTDNTAADLNPVFSPDGAWIVYQSDEANDPAFDIRMINLADGEIRQLTDTVSGEEAPSWRP